MQRFFLENELIGENQLIIQDKELLNQILKVLRANIGDKFIFFNSMDFIDYIYVLTSFDKKNMIFSIDSKIVKNHDDKIINLYQSLPNKIDKLEFILQKGVEVGYSNFFIFKANRSQKLFLSDNKIQRLEKIIKEAVEQSGRNVIPKLTFLDNLDLKTLNCQNLFFHTNDKNSKLLSSFEFQKTLPINVFIGPEGGFDEKEINIFTKNNFNQIYLGNNILRTETASIGVGFYLNQIL